ncbi:RDD family protein [Lentisphaera profundi]|uniref:RDD family protein n=1 Tax=Lentisphaera profundi TaxID=1658616 RepID=A0ABY7VY33_9BACT|nr:RDD family protein [Lentisphaera profundi]WDE98125.1 RDD family protein [Lentisphaera profundi]
MEESNIYAAPQAEVLDDSNINFNLASRSQRFMGSLIDGVIMSCVTLPLMYFTGGFDGVTEGREPSFAYTAGITVVGIIVFVLINFKFLSSNGQTIGKKVVKTKIVMNDGEPAGLSGPLLKRYSVYFFLGLIPVIGQILSMINILIIFGGAKRCGHDYAGGTKVVAI